MENREIKFRGFSKTDKIFVYGSLNTYKDASAIITNFEGTQSWVVDTESVGQYTGLKDKNCVPIYEGDIVICFINGEPIGALDTIEFKDGAFSLRARNITLREWNTMPNDEYGSDLEVIGNVYQNSDLLK